MTEEQKASYLARRNNLIEILNSLKSHWDLAEGLSVFIGSGYVTPEVIDGVEKLLEEALSNVRDTSSREAIEHGLSKIQEMKAREADERRKEQEKLSSMGFTDLI